MRGRLTCRAKKAAGRPGALAQEPESSGSAASSDNDLTAQIAGTVEVGQVVSIRGTVATDKDFGAGYSYPVIVQDGVVQP